MGIKDHFEGKRDLGLIDPRKLTVDPTYNVRNLDKPEAREGLDYLKSLIRTTGVQTPLRIREEGNQLIIVRGHRRHKVVMELIEEGHPIKLVPVTQEPRGTTPAERNWDLIDSNSEEPLKGFERADALYRQIHVFGWTEKEILLRTGKTQQWLNQQLELRTIDPETKQMVDDGILSVSTAREVTKHNGTETPAILKEAKKIAASEGKKKITRTTINKTKTGSARPRQTAMPLAVGPDVQRSIDVCGALTSIAVLQKVSEKADDEMVQVPASVLKAARAAHQNAPAPAKPLSDAALDRLAKTQSAPAKPEPQTTENDRRDGATYSEDQTAEACSDNNPVNASDPTLREAPEPQTIPELVVPASITFYEVFDALQTLKTQASEVVERNKDDDHPGYWTQSLVDAIADAERIIERVNGAAVTGGAEQ